MKMWIRIQAVLALLFAAGFYVLVAAAALGLGWAGLQVVLFATHVRGRGVILVGVVALALIAAGVVVLWSIFPRVHRFEPPGPELEPHKHPKLFREIERIAAFSGEKAPRHVYALADVNAFVTEAGGVMGFFSKRVMGVGIPLLSNLTVGQFRGVLAHEFGHYAGGDVKLLPWINKARQAMMLTLNNLSGAADSANQGELAIASLIFSIVGAPFRFLAELYMRFTQAFSRAQEIAADTLAITLCGAKVHAEALTQAEHAGLAFGVFLREDLEPLLQVGRVPPLATGFQQFLSSDFVQKALNEPRERAPRDPFDSHPSLEERLAHAKRLGNQVAAVLF